MTDHRISSNKSSENDSTHFFPVIVFKRSIESHAPMESILHSVGVLMHNDGWWRINLYGNSSLHNRRRGREPISIPPTVKIIHRFHMHFGDVIHRLAAVMY